MRAETKTIKKAWYVLEYRFQEASKGLNLNPFITNHVSVLSILSRLTSFKFTNKVMITKMSHIFSKLN